MTSLSNQHADCAVRTGRVVSVSDGLKLHIAEAGRVGDPLILLLHGFPESGAAWYCLMPQLARGAYVVAPDLRGYGLSDCPEEVAAYRIERLVADIRALLSELGYSSCALVGHDWGGALAWAVAIASPECVARLIILNAPHPIAFARALAGDAAQQAASQYMNWLRRPGSEDVLARDDFALLDKMFVNSSARPWYAGAIRETYHRNWSRPGVLRGMVNWYRATPLAPPVPGTHSVSFTVPSVEGFIVRVPTLVLWGEKDTALLVDLLSELEVLVPGVLIHRLAHASHWLVHEEPDAVAAHILAFTRDLPVALR